LAVFIAAVSFTITILFSIAILAAFLSVRADIKKIEDKWSQSYTELERENRLAQLKIDEFRMALMNAGIEPNPHLSGEVE